VKVQQLVVRARRHDHHTAVGDELERVLDRSRVGRNVDHSRRQLTAGGDPDGREHDDHADENMLQAHRSPLSGASITSGPVRSCVGASRMDAGPLP
jgi:hypothetical protein